MNKQLRETQLKVLKAFVRATKTFALSGGTALELFYLKHRFSRDLDFFSSAYSKKEIDDIISKLSKSIDGKIRLESEFVTPGHANVRFYSLNTKGAELPLKIDFIEDVLFPKPSIRKFENIPVYDEKNIYFQKIITLTGTHLIMGETGRELITGRREARDMVDVYYLSKKVEPLHRFIQKLKKQYQRGLVHWYRSYSRHEVKLGVLDLDLYDNEFDALEMIRYLDAEIKKFVGEVIK